MHNYSTFKYSPPPPLSLSLMKWLRCLFWYRVWFKIASRSFNNQEICWHNCKESPSACVYSVLFNKGLLILVIHSDYVPFGNQVVSLNFVGISRFCSWCHDAMMIIRIHRLTKLALIRPTAKFPLNTGIPITVNVDVDLIHRWCVLIVFSYKHNVCHNHSTMIATIATCL